MKQPLITSAGRVLRVLAVLVLFAVAMDAAGVILGTRNLPDTAYRVNVPRNSVDVAFVGSSHQYNSVISQLLYDEYGIAAVDFAVSGAMSRQVEPLVSLLLERQQPKVVVLDLFSFLAPYTYSGMLNCDAQSHFERSDNYYALTAHIANATSWLNPKRITAVVSAWREDPNALPFFLPVALRHDELTALDGEELKGKPITHLGYHASFTSSVAAPRVFTEEELAAAQLYAPYEDIIRRVITRLQRAGCEVVCTFQPYVMNDAERIVAAQALSLAESFGAYAVPPEALEAQADFDFPQDYQDISHLNTRGAMKLTPVWGRLLTERYDLPDRRASDSALYAPWRERPRNYLSQIAAHALSDTGDFSAYVDRLAQLDDQYAVLIAVRERDALPEQAARALAAITALPEGGCAFALSVAGQARISNGCDSFLDTPFDGDAYLAYGGCHVGLGAETVFAVGEETLRSAGGGTQIVVAVYDTLHETFVDSARFQPDGDAMTRRPL